jgi:phosphate transport system ATP-binding protein
MSKNILSTHDLNIHIDEKHILKDVNVEIPQRKLTVIIGPSGCGKTTLLKTFNRLIDLLPEVKKDGKVIFQNEEILHRKNNLTELRKQMGLLSQRPYPLPMSIYRNVSFGLGISGRKNKKALDKRVEQYLRLASLWEEVKDRLHDPASGLSIGQQQRLCLARGLAVDPLLILADEPTSALDPISTQAIEDKFIELKSRYSIIMVTHILRQAKRIADHVIFMYLGEVIEQGPADTFFSAPKHDLTKKYLEGIIH